jgi:membrane-bound ClpP family serine protease
VGLTFQFGKFAGGLAIIGCLVVLPTLALAAIKIWPHTPIGKRIAPVNRVADHEDRVNTTALLEPLVGKFGRALSPLRPVGLCEFGGRRVECVAELGMIEVESCVEATGIRGSALMVRAAPSRGA